MRKTMVIILTLFTSLLLAGCTNDPVEETPTFDPENANEIEATYLQYSVGSTNNIIIPSIPLREEYLVTDILGNEMAYDQVLAIDEYVEVTSSYLALLDREVTEFYLYYDDVKTLVSITTSSTTHPFLMSSSVVYTSGEVDQTFQFELFGGSVSSVTATGLTDSDYTINGDLLIINAAYIKSMLENHDSFVIHYVLEHDSFVTGIIEIQEQK